MPVDPFAKASAIRKGELDAEIPMYEELTGWLQRVPITWLPGMLASVIHQCVVRKVFKEGALEKYMRRSEEVANDEFRMLRDQAAQPAEDGR